MILTCLAFAFWAFLIASNIFNSFWTWLATAIITFIIMAVAVTYELGVLLGIVIVILALMTIVILISKRK